MQRDDDAGQFATERRGDEREDHPNVPRLRIEVDVLLGDVFVPPRQLRLPVDGRGIEIVLLVGVVMDYGQALHGMDHDGFAAAILRFGEDEFASIVTRDVVQEYGNAGHDAEQYERRIHSYTMITCKP